MRGWAPVDPTPLPLEGDRKPLSCDRVKLKARSAGVSLGFRQRRSPRHSQSSLGGTEAPRRQPESSFSSSPPLSLQFSTSYTRVGCAVKEITGIRERERQPFAVSCEKIQKGKE